jgi:hypothetical protein
MKLTCKQSYTYLMLIMIISSNLIAIVDLKSTKNSRSTTDKKSKKVRKHGEVCYHSVPHWEEKNGNFPCAKGLICRPPAKAKAPKGKPIPYKCFKDNKQNRSKGNIHFTSKKQRATEESYLFSITYKTPKISGRESTEEGDIAQSGQDCHQATPDYKPRTCVTGTTCKLRAQDQGKSGATSYCLADEAKENEVCYKPILNFVKLTCATGLICRNTTADLKSGMKGISSYCLKPTAKAKINEQCMGNGSTIAVCETGLACKEKPVDPNVKVMQTLGKNKFCLKDDLSAYENEVCNKSIRDYQKKNCVGAGLICRFKEEDMNSNKTGSNSYCLKPIVAAKLNEVCAEAMQGGIKKDCDKNLTCMKKPADLNNQLARSYCLATVKVGAGDVCQGGSSAESNCPTGFVCRIKDASIQGTNQTGQKSHCLIKIAAATGTEGTICSRPITSFKTIQCKEGLECKPTAEDLKLGHTGISSFCQKKSNTANEVTVAGEGQDCAKSTPGYVSKQCTAGTNCRPPKGKESMGGVTSICQKPNNLDGNNYNSQTTINKRSIVVEHTLVIGASCSSGGAKQCPSGHICKNSFKSNTNKTYCLLPSAFDSAGYTPFVGINNYCNSTKKCTSGSTCTEVYDGTKVCIAKIYGYNGKPVARRRR